MAEQNIYLDTDSRRLPYAIEAEQSVLGSMIINPSCVAQVVSEVKPEHFYIPQHQAIFRVLLSMFELNQTTDYVSLLEKLKTKGVYDEAGGKAYLMQLAQVVPTTANVSTYIEIVKQKYYARSLITVAEEIIKDASENTYDAGELLDSAEQKIYDIRQGRDVSGLTPIADIIQNETYDRLSKMADPETREDYIGIPCGIGDLDRMITGLNKSDLIILGARPGMGKTSFALNIAREVSMRAKRTVAFFSLEMTRDQLAQRMLSNEASIKSEKLRTGDLTPEEWTRLAQAGAHLSEAPLYFDETSSITVPEMKAKLLRMKKLDLVIIDYLGLMHSAKKTENRVNEVSEITRSLKVMAKELKVPVIVCAQLSRGTEAKGKSHRPALSDLRESGSIEQDADIVLFLYRDIYYDNEKADGEERSDPNKAECIVAKNRHGELGTVDLYWDGQFTRFLGQDTYH